MDDSSTEVRKLTPLRPVTTMIFVPLEGMLAKSLHSVYDGYAEGCNSAMHTLKIFMRRYHYFTKSRIAILIHRWKLKLNPQN
jgi:hypothetical protein